MAAANAPHVGLDHLLGGDDIAAMLGTSGPTVKCVVLRASSGKKEQESSEAKETSNSEEANDDKMKSQLQDHLGDVDQKPSAKQAIAKCSDEKNEDEADEGREPYRPLENLIDEIELDMTPKKSMVQKVMGGPITFLGQYEDEGTMVVVQRPENSSDDEEDITKLPPVNPHKLQPPLHNYHIRGDILLIRVAPTNEVLDEDDDESDKKEEASKKDSHLVVPTNDEFFQNYTKEEYIKFAKRTDIEVPEEDDADDDEEVDESYTGGDDDDDGEDDDSDEDYNLEEDEMTEEENQVGIMNMLMGELLRKFQEVNGRGPDTRELLEIRSALAEKLGVPVPEVVDDVCTKESSSREKASGKRKTNGDGDSSKKRVKFSSEDDVAEKGGIEENMKVASANGQIEPVKNKVRSSDKTES